MATPVSSHDVSMPRTYIEFLKIVKVNGIIKGSVYSVGRKAFNF